MENHQLIQELYKRNIPEKNIYLEESMKKHTSFKIGGKADIFIKATTIEQIREVVELSKINEIPLHIIGNGTNLLVKDEGIKGIVLKSELNNIEIQEDSQNVFVKVGSGVLLSALAQKLLQNGITGFEFASGIPGTIGGAIRMNAGAHGGEMKDIVKQTTYMDMEGQIHKISLEEHQFEYRTSIFANEKNIILETELQLQYGDKQKIKQTMEEYTKWRKENQPLEYPNAGSTFKRGSDFITAKLIDECGLKGYKIGGAQVSSKHAGFIVNIGGATAQDVMDLAKYVREAVYKRYGKTIELEIEVLG